MNGIDMSDIKIIFNKTAPIIVDDEYFTVQFNFDLNGVLRSDFQR